MISPTTDAADPELAKDDELYACAICEALAAERGVDPLDLPPLQEHVDMDALVTLLDSSDGADTQVTFTHEGDTVTVWADGTVDVSVLSAGATNRQGLAED
jgi:hypothetical protein